MAAVAIPGIWIILSRDWWSPSCCALLMDIMWFFIRHSKTGHKNSITRALTILQTERMASLISSPCLCFPAPAPLCSGCVFLAPGSPLGWWRLRALFQMFQRQNKAAWLSPWWVIDSDPGTTRWWGEGSESIIFADIQPHHTYSQHSSDDDFYWQF